MEEEITCIVCFEPLDMNLGNVKTPCNHNYCMDCFIKHMRVSSDCAICRRKLTNQEPNKEKQDTYNENTNHDDYDINGEVIWPHIGVILNNFNNLSSMIDTGQYSRSNYNWNITPSPTPNNESSLFRENNPYGIILHQMLSRDGGYSILNNENFQEIGWPFMPILNNDINENET